MKKNKNNKIIEFINIKRKYTISFFLGVGTTFFLINLIVLFTFISNSIQFGVTYESNITNGLYLSLISSFLLLLISSYQLFNEK
jgi:hypothetical protein